MKTKKAWITQYRILFVVAAVLVAAAVPVIAYFVRSSGEVINTFTPDASVQPQIKETFENAVKKNVYFEVGDTGYPVYVRAAVIVTWQKENGTVYFKKPVAQEDYTITLNTDDWVEETSVVDDDQNYYYLKYYVESGGVTPILIESCTQNSSSPPADGYTLNVDVLVQTVQAIGYTDEEEIPAYVDAWELKKQFEN